MSEIKGLNKVATVSKLGPNGQYMVKLRKPAVCLRERRGAYAIYTYTKEV